MTVVIGVIAGCGDDTGGGGEAAPPGTSLATTTTMAPVAGGTLTYATFGPLPGLDPITTTGAGGTGGSELAALYDLIMRFDAKTGNYEPRTAESLTSNAESTVWTLKLRPNIKFSDGTAYDAAAVKFSVERSLSTASRANYKGMLTGAKIAVVDPLTVQFTLAQPWGDFPFVLTTSTAGMIVSPTAVQKLGSEFNLNAVGAGAGPFVLESFKPGEELTLKRNPNYWGGTVYLDTLKFVPFGSGGPQALEHLEAKSAQAAYIRDSPTAARAAEKKYESYVNPVIMGGVIQPNHGHTITGANGQVTQTNPITKDIRVRRAVAAALDPKVINDRAFKGTALTGSEVFLQNSRWYSGVAGPKYDPVEAKRLVDEVKATGWNGSIRLLCPVGSQDLGLTVATMLRAVGFDVVVKSDVDIAALSAQVLVQKDYDLACWGLGLQEPSPFPALDSAFGAAIANARYGYTSPAMEAALGEARGARDAAAAKAAYAKIAKVITDDVATIPYGAIAEVVAWDYKVHGIQGSTLTIVLFDKAWMQP